MVTGVSLKGICLSIAHFQWTVSYPSIDIYITNKIFFIFMLFKVLLLKNKHLTYVVQFISQMCNGKNTFIIIFFGHNNNNNN